jgi:predicted membrane channel-forming protein YqfA (hemolysin III family)
MIWHLPVIAQDPAYHQMADQRTILGIPNFANAMSNLAFLVVGLIGLRATAQIHFTHPWGRRPWLVLFAGTVLTALGSTWYHLAPDDTRLVWDRLPMTLGFMGLLTATLAERISLDTCRRWFVPLLILGVASVFYWSRTGNLLFYVLVQFGSLLAVVALLAVRPARCPGTPHVIAALIAYAVAKIFEAEDQAIYDFGHFVSGHTLKHLAAAAGVGCLAVRAGRIAKECKDVSSSPFCSSS